MSFLELVLDICTGFQVRVPLNLGKFLHHKVTGIPKLRRNRKTTTGNVDADCRDVRQVFRSRPHLGALSTGSQRALQ